MSNLENNQNESIEELSRPEIELDLKTDKAESEMKILSETEVYERVILNGVHIQEFFKNNHHILSELFEVDENALTDAAQPYFHNYETCINLLNEEPGENRGMRLMSKLHIRNLNRGRETLSDTLSTTIQSAEDGKFALPYNALQELTHGDPSRISDLALLWAKDWFNFIYPLGSYMDSEDIERLSCLIGIDSRLIGTELTGKFTDVIKDNTLGMLNQFSEQENDTLARIRQYELDHEAILSLYPDGRQLFSQMITGKNYYVAMEEDNVAALPLYTEIENIPDLVDEIAQNHSELWLAKEKMGNQLVATGILFSRDKAIQHLGRRMRGIKEGDTTEILGILSGNDICLNYPESLDYSGFEATWYELSSEGGKENVISALVRFHPQSPIHSSPVAW